jgi:uncharacterized protein (DUF4415 family)
MKSIPNPSAELAEILNRKIPSEMVADALFRALTATQTTRSGTVEAATREQLQAASLILQYKVGRPVERQEIVSVNLDADSMTGLRERLRSSPAMRETLAGLLAEVEGAAIDV